MSAKARKALLPPPAQLGRSDGPDLDPAVLRCTGCDTHPRDLHEYRAMGRSEEMSPEAFVWMFEGTLNRANGHFLCTPCYARAGSPHGPNGTRWVAP